MADEQSTSLTSTEPVVVASALTAAASATVAVIALIANWSADVVVAVNGATAAWIIVGSLLLRRKVTPTNQVALTNEQAEVLRANGF